MSTVPPARPRGPRKPKDVPPSIGLSAVVVAGTRDEPRVLVIRTEPGRPDALPSGPLEPQHRTLEAGLRAWVER